jgi:hypothetical protein
MAFDLDEYKDNENNVDKLLNTFRTPFWLEEHQWFVRYNWHPSNSDKDGILYTLPYGFNEYVYYDNILSKSTCSNNQHYWTYNHVRILRCPCSKTPSNKSNLFHGNFPNIDHLEIEDWFN